MRYRKLTSKMISFLLAAVMVASLLPGWTVSAAEAETPYSHLEALSNRITVTPGQLVGETGEIVDSEIYGYVVNYVLKKGHVLSISDENYVFSVRKLVDGNYSTMLKQATAASFTATEDMTVGMLIRKPDKSAVTAEELADIVIYDTQYGMKDVEGFAHRFTVEAETIDGGTHTTRANIFLPPDYAEDGEPTRLIVMTNGHSAYLTNSVWNGNTANNVGVIRNYLNAGYAVWVVDNTDERTGKTPDLGCPQLVDSYLKAYEYIQTHFNVEERFSIHSRSFGTFAAMRIMREVPELVKCAVMTGARVSLKKEWPGLDKAFIAKRFGFEDTTGATYEADKLVGYDPYTDVDGEEYTLPPTYWVLCKGDATERPLEVVEKLIAHGNDVDSIIWTDTDHSGVCTLNTEEMFSDALAFLEEHQETEDEGIYTTLTPEDYLTVSNPDTEQLACAPGLVSYGDGNFAVAYLADDTNTVETESSTTIVCRLGLFSIDDPENGTFVDVATAGQTIGNVTIGNKAPYEPNLLKLSDEELLVLFNIRDTAGKYTYYSAKFDTAANSVVSYEPLTLDGREWIPANIAASYNALAKTAISTSGPTGSMVFTSRIIQHDGYFYGYCGGISAGFSGILVRSTDGINWTSVMVPEAASDMNGVIECGFQIVDDTVYFCMRDISSGIYHCSCVLSTGEQLVETTKLPGLTTSKPCTFIQDGDLYLIVNKATGDDSTVGRRNTALFYKVDPETCALQMVKQVFCADGCAYHSVAEYENTNYWCFHTDARRINPYTQGRSNLAFLKMPDLSYAGSGSGELDFALYAHCFGNGCITVAANSWQGGAVNTHYQIPVTDFIGFDQVTVTANSEQKSYIAFFTKKMSASGEIAYAEGWEKVLIMEPGTMQRLAVPADASYMYILATNAAGDSLLPESVVFSKDEPAWEQGTIASATGLDRADTTRLRTADYLLLSDYSGMGINTGYTMTNFVYDENYTYLGTSSWLGDGMPFTTAELQNKYPAGVYFRVVFRANDQRNLTEEDITASGVKFYLPGEEVPTPDFGFSFENIGSIGTWQDGAIWDGKLFVFGANGNGAVYDAATAVKLGGITLDMKDVLLPYANSVCFGSTRYAEGDKYPLLYVNIYNNYASAADRMEGTCCVYRVTEEDGTFSTDLVQVIRIGFTEDLTLWKSKENNGDVRPYGNFAVDTDNDKLYAFVMRDADKTTRFFSFDIPGLEEGSYTESYGCNTVTLETADIRTQFDSEHYSYLQGCCYSSGMILYMGDFGGDAPLYAVDLESQKVKARICLGYAGLKAEPEVICADPVSGVLYYAAADGMLRKIVLDDIHLHSYETAVIDSTCTERGYTTYTCACGDSYVDDYVEALGHAYSGTACTVCGAEHPNLANYKGKVISILGDSISTFAGYIPVADGFNLTHLARYPQDNLLTDVNETWWMQVITALNGKLGINDSWRGSTVSGYPSVTTGVAGYLAAMSNTTQIQNLGSNGTPDVILFYGGTNDLAHTPKLGSFDPDTAPTEVDLTTLKWDNLADAYCHALLRLRHFHPDAEILCLLPTYTASYYSNDKLAQGNALLTAICEHYGVAYVDLRYCGITTADLPDGIHPDAAGMDYITDAVLDALFAQCEMEPGENTVYTVTHTMSGVTASLGYYKGISAEKAFTETLTADSEITVTVTMGGVDITDSCCADGTIAISAVTGDLVIDAKARFSLGDRLLQLPENICAGTNLWPLLEHDPEYYTANGWGVHSSGKVYSVTIPVNPSDQIWATSFGKAGTNGSSTNGIRLTWFGEYGVVKSLSAGETYSEFTANGFLTVPEGVNAVNVVMWTNDDSNELYLLNREHAYSAGLCTVCDHDSVETAVDSGTLTVACDEMERDTLIWLVSYDGSGKFVAMKRVALGETLTLPTGERYVLLFVDDSWIPLRKQLEL